MRKLIALSCAAAAVAFAGCANDAESPFAVKKGNAPKAPTAVEKPAPVAVAPAPTGEAANVSVDAAPIVVNVTKDTQFVVNGTTVSWDDFAATMNKLGKENPGKSVTLLLEDGFNANIVKYVHNTCKSAGLGAVQGR